MAQNYNPTHPKLTEGELLFATRDKVRNYPEVVRSESDPVLPGQSYVGLSYIYFDSPKTLRDGSTAYGLVKVRGVGPTADSVQNIAANLLQDTDSKHEILIAPIGKWLPISNSKNLVAETVSSDSKYNSSNSSKEEKEKEFSMEAIKNAREKDRVAIASINRRKDELVKGGDIYDTPESLSMYIMKRNVDTKLAEEILRSERKLNELKKKQFLTRQILHKLDTDNPSYLTEWIPRYNEERRKTGIPDFTPQTSDVESYENFRNSNTVSSEPLKTLIDNAIKD